MKSFATNKLPLIFFLLLPFSGNAETILTDYYTVVSDSFSADIEKGKCLVKGKIIDAYSEQGVVGGLVSNFNKTVYTTSNDNGYYELELGVNDTAIFFYHEQYGEVVVWSYTFKSQHIVEINFVTANKSSDQFPIIQEKPIIYLYPEVPTNVKVSLDSKIELTYSYPAYNNGWSVFVEKNGTITDDRNRSYPYLFWEGISDDLSIASNEEGYIGTLVNTDSTISFLENKLETFGFNSTETTDFITYWAPRMIKHPFVVVNFLVDENYNRQIGELTIEPQPDAIRRVYMIFQGFSKAPTCIPLNESIKPLNREGFVVVEWGGSEINVLEHP